MSIILGSLSRDLFDAWSSCEQTCLFTTQSNATKTPMVFRMPLELRAIFMALELWARWKGGVAVKEILVELKALHATKMLKRRKH